MKLVNCIKIIKRQIFFSKNINLRGDIGNINGFMG